MIAVCFGTVPRMHKGSARGRNCDIKVVELMNEPFRSNDWSTLVFNRTTMVHIELPLTTGDERKFDAWVKLCIRLLDKCVENGGTIVVLCPFNTNSRVVSVFVRTHVDFVAISMGDKFDMLSKHVPLASSLSHLMCDGFDHDVYVDAVRESFCQLCFIRVHGAPAVCAVSPPRARHCSPSLGLARGARGPLTSVPLPA
jgi:hypothetical protein